MAGSSQKILCIPRTCLTVAHWCQDRVGACGPQWVKEENLYQQMLVLLRVKANFIPISRKTRCSLKGPSTKISWAQSGTGR